MTLPELIAFVEGSEFEDWEQLPRPLLASWEHSTGPGKTWGLVPVHYGDAYVHKGDLDVVLAWGAEYEVDMHRDLQQDPWVVEGNFNDRPVPLTDVTLIYRGLPIREWEFARLDNRRILVPVPDLAGGKYVISPDLAKIGRLIHYLANDDVACPSMDAVFNRCKVSVGK
jgi:hypothetical protein